MAVGADGKDRLDEAHPGDAVHGPDGCKLAFRIFTQVDVYHGCAVVRGDRRAFIAVKKAGNLFCQCFALFLAVSCSFSKKLVAVADNRNGKAVNLKELYCAAASAVRVHNRGAAGVRMHGDDGVVGLDRHKIRNDELNVYAGLPGNGKGIAQPGVFRPEPLQA